MKKIVILLLLVLTYSCTLSRRVKSPQNKIEFSLNAQYKFYLYDGTVIEGDFQGIEQSHFYVIGKRNLYKIRRNSLKNVRDAEGDAILKQILRINDIFDIDWENVDKFVDLATKNPGEERERRTKLSYPHSLQVQLTKNNHLALNWQIMPGTSKRRRSYLAAFRIDKKIDNSWELDYQIVGVTDTTWTDTDVQPNARISYRLSSVQSRENLSVLDQIDCYSNTDTGIYWLDNYIDVPAGEFEFHDDTCRLTNNYAMSSREISCQDYAAMLNFALPRDLLAGAYKNNKTLYNKPGRRELLLDLASPRCPITFSDNMFHVKSAYEKLPMQQVSWYGAAFYCHVYSLYAGQYTDYQSLYDFEDWTVIINGTEGYRLPTEAEWAYASMYNLDAPPIITARGDVLGANNTDDQWKSKLGFIDLAASVSEMCQDWYASDPIYDLDNPVQADKKRYKVSMGASYLSTKTDYLQRDRFIPTKFYPHLGFRVLRVITSSQAVASPSKNLPHHGYWLEDLSFPHPK